MWARNRSRVSLGNSWNPRASSLFQLNYLTWTATYHVHGTMPAMVASVARSRKENAWVFILKTGEVPIEGREMDSCEAR